VPAAAAPVGAAATSPGARGVADTLGAGVADTLGAGDTGGSAFNPIVAGPGCGTGTWTKDGASSAAGTVCAICHRSRGATRQQVARAPGLEFGLPSVSRQDATAFS